MKIYVGAFRILSTLDIDTGKNGTKSLVNLTEKSEGSHSINSYMLGDQDLCPSRIRTRGYH
jgi:hypothetical protein